MKSLPPNIVLSEKVQTALLNGDPVVALESTVITHGLPYPLNLDIFMGLEDILRQRNVQPATIIVLDGVVHIGLEQKDLDMVTEKLQKKRAFDKLGMRDLALAQTHKRSGGTTVSATMRLASLCCIEVFATGGIGGVHRNWENTLDISSDLKALAEIPVAVVSAGCKAILDIPATIEYMETNAIPVIGWRTTEFPLFYSARSPYPIDNVDNIDDLATLWYNHLALGGKGMLIANPIPETASLDGALIESSIKTAIDKANVLGIYGKELTPFLLDFLAQHTKGASVEANLALLKNNVLLAADLATEMTKHR
jgi:pseudouridylate synthase